MKHPLLTAQDERRLARQGRRGRAELVRCNQALVRRIAAGFMGRGLDFEDLVQEGNIGLLRAAKLFDPRRGTRFSTYAVPWIRQPMLAALKDQVPLVRLPRYLYATGRRPARTYPLFDEEGRPTVKVFDRPALGLPPPELRETIAAAIADLPLRHRIVLEERFLRFPGLTLEELGRALRLCRERVRQIEADALDRLRAHPALRPWAEEVA